MAEIDSLEISIQSNIDKVNRNMDLLIQKMGTVARGISAIGSNKGLDEFIKSTKTASESVGNISKKVEQSVKPIEGQMQKIAKTFEQVGEPFKDIGKGFKVSGGIEDIEKSIQKYENELERAKLREQELSAAGKTDTEGYKTAVARVIEYRNVVESLKAQLDEVSKARFSYPEPQKFEIEDDITEHLRSVGAFAELKDYIEDVKNSLNQATEEVRGFSGAWNGIELPDFSDKEIVKLSIDEEKFSGTIEAFKEELKEIDSIIEGGGQEGEAGTLYPVARLQRALSNLKQMHPEAVDLISSYEEEMNRLDEAMSGGAKTQKFGKIDLTKFDQAKEKAQDFEAVLNSLRNIQPQINETNITKLQKKLKAVEEQTEKLRYELEKGLRFGTISDKQFDNLTIKIRESENTAEELKKKIEEVGRGGVKERVENLSKSFAKVSSASKKLSKALSGVVNSLKKFAKGVVSVFSRVGKLAKSMLLLGSATKKSNGGFNLGLKTILKYGFGIRSLYVLVNKLRRAIKEGMENLVQYSDKTNQSVSMLSSSISQFKNASAAAFAPILNAIAPALNSLIQLFVRATNAINQFFSALTGHGTWIRAKYVYEDVAESISGAADAAKGALQPFDKLNNLTTQKGAGAGGIEPGDMFETVPLEDKFKDLTDWLKDMWKNADFYDLGRKLGEELQHALANIPWDKIKTTARKLGKSLATLINGFVEVEGLGKAIGYSLAQALNTAYEFANSFVHSLNWESIGKFIAETINGFIQNIDWSLIRDTLITGAKGLADAINSFVDYLDWDTVATTISNSVNALSDTIIMFFERTDWSELGHKVGYTLEKSIENIDFERVGRAIADILQSALDFASGVIAELNWDEIKSAIKDLLTGFFGNITIPDNLKGIITALVGIEGAVLSLKGVMGTAKLAKSFSDIWDAAKKLQKLKLPKMFTDIKGAFSPFSNAFKQFKNSFSISGDLFGSFKNGFSSLSSGLETFRANLSPVTKGVVGLTAVFAEFKVVGNAFDDIIKGTGNLSTSIGKIAAAAGAAATALSVVFGVPAGIIIAGVTAAVAGLKSLNDHFNELEVERVGERIRDSLSTPGGVSLYSIVDQYADTFAEMRGQFTNISDQAAKVDMLDDSITNVYRDIDQIKLSMDAGVISVEEGAERLGLAFKELEQITSEHFGNINDMLTSAFGEGGAYETAFDNAEISSKDYLTSQLKLNDAAQERVKEIHKEMAALDINSKEYQALAAEERALLGVQDATTEATNRFQSSLENIDLSGIVDEYGNYTDSLSTNLEYLSSGATSAIGAVQSAGDELLSTIERQKQTAVAAGDIYAEYANEVAKTVTQEKTDEIIGGVENSSEQVLNAIQTKLIDAIKPQISKAEEEWSNLTWPEKAHLNVTKGITDEASYVKAQLDEYLNNTLIPAGQQIDETIAEIGIEGTESAVERFQGLYGELFEATRVYGTSQYSVTMASDINSILESAKQEIAPKTQEVGENIGAGIRDGILNNISIVTDAAKQVMESAINGAKEEAGIHSPSTVFAEIGKNLMLGLSNGVNQNSSVVLQRLSDFASKLKNPFSGISESFASVGRNLMSGLKNGISSMASSVYNKISEIGNGIAGKMRKVLDIHSPSRVMFELGDFTMQGFQNGLESLYQPIISSVKSFGSDLTVAPAMGIDRSYMDYKQASQYIPEYQPQGYQTGMYYGGNSEKSNESLMRALIKQNEKVIDLLEGILDKPVIDDDMSFQSSRRGYDKEKNRLYGKSGTTLPVWG